MLTDNNWRVRRAGRPLLHRRHALGLFPLVLILPLAFLSTPLPTRAACSDLPTFADGRSPTRELHVATTGSDSTGDGSPGKPYATIRYAAGRATPGTAVIVHAGTYAGGGFIYDLTGTTDAPIWIGGAQGEDRPLACPVNEARPVIAGGSEGLHFVRAKYVIVHDLEVRGAASNGINADDGGEYGNPLASHHLLFQRLYIHDIGGTGNQDGLKLSGINDFFVLDCEIARCGGAMSGSGIDHVGCHRGMIARCTFHDLSANAVQCKGGSEDIEIRWCRMVQAGERAVNIGGSTGFEFFRPPLSESEPNFEARNIRVLANVIQGATASVAYVGAVECVVANNTIVDPHNWILRILQETVSSPPYEFLPCGHNRFENNLVYFDRSDLSTYVNIGPNTAPQTFVFAHNLWYAHDNPQNSRPNLPTQEQNGIYGRDPLLFDPVTGDWRIPPASPAANAGLRPARVAADFRLTCYRDPPSIGAHEVTILGDLNCDRLVNFADINAFVLALGSEQEYRRAYPDCDRLNADANRDGTVDFADINPFVLLLSGAAG